MSNTTNKSNVVYKIIDEKLVEGEGIDEIVIYTHPKTGKKRHVSNAGWYNSSEGTIENTFRMQPMGMADAVRFTRDFFFAQGQLHALNYFKEWVGKIYADKYKKQICMDKIGARIEELEETEKLKQSEAKAAEQEPKEKVLSDKERLAVFSEVYRTGGFVEHKRDASYNYMAIKAKIKEIFADYLDISSDRVSDFATISPAKIRDAVEEELEDVFWLMEAIPKTNNATIIDESLKVAYLLSREGRFLQD